MIPENQPAIFTAIAAQNLEEVEAIIHEEGIAAIISEYNGRNAIDHVFGLLESPGSYEACAALMEIARRLVETYTLARRQGRVADHQQLDFQRPLAQALHYRGPIGTNLPLYPLITAILDAGGRINEPLPGERFSALGQAIIEKNRKLVHFLLEHGANPEALDKEGQSYITLAHDRRQRNILWDMLIHLTLHRLDPDLADIFAGGYPDKVKAMLDEEKLAGGELLSVLGVALWFGGSLTAMALLTHYLSVMPDTEEVRDDVFNALLIGLLRCDSAAVLHKIAELNILDDKKARYLLSKAIDLENDILAAWLVESDFICITIVETSPPSCPNFTEACLNELQGTVTAFLETDLITDDIFDDAITAMIQENSYEFLGDLLRLRPRDAQTSIDFIVIAVTGNKPFCLLELINAGCDPSWDIMIHNNDDIDIIDNDSFDDFALSIAFETMEGPYPKPIDRFTCVLLLLVATSTPDLRLYQLCDCIMIDRCLDQDYESVTFLTRVGFGPEDLLRRFVRDYRDSDIDADTKRILCDGAVAACNGVISYLDTILSWNSHQLILEGCMGLFRIDEPPALPLDIDLINLLCKIADKPDAFDDQVVKAVNALVNKIAAVLIRISGPKSLVDLSSEIVLDTYPSETDTAHNSLFELFCSHVNQVVWIERIDRRNGAQQKSYQLIAQQLLLTGTVFSDYAFPDIAEVLAEQRGD